MRCGDAADDAAPGMHLDTPVAVSVVASLLVLLVVLVL